MTDKDGAKLFEIHVPLKRKAKKEKEPELEEEPGAEGPGSGD